MQHEKQELPKLEKPALESMSSYAWILLLVVGIWALIGFFPWFMNVVYGGQTWKWGLDRPGVFGDSFGFVNALFSGLALAGVIIAIFLQRKELFEQRKQLYYQYQELIESVKTQQESQKALSSQASYNLIAETLNLASHFNRSDEFDPDETYGRGNPTPSKELIYRSAAKDLIDCTYNYVHDSLKSLDNFPVPSSLRFLPEELFLQSILFDYHQCLVTTYGSDDSKLEVLIECLKMFKVIPCGVDYLSLIHI